MTSDQVELAIREGIPFLIKMADGEKYAVLDPLQIALGKSQVIVVDKDGLAHALPLPTMTGIRYLKSKR